VVRQILGSMSQGGLTSPAMGSRRSTAASARSTRRSTTWAPAHIVVDTGPWIFGKKVMLPAGVVDRIDAQAEAVYVNLSKDEIKDAPELDEATYREETYQEALGGYYGRGEPVTGRAHHPDVQSCNSRGKKGLWASRAPSPLGSCLSDGVLPAKSPQLPDLGRDAGRGTPGSV